MTATRPHCIECGLEGADESFLCEACKPLYADNDNHGRADETEGDMA